MLSPVLDGKSANEKKMICVHLPALGAGLKIGPRMTHAERELFSHLNRYSKVCVKFRESLMLRPIENSLHFYLDVLLNLQ